MALYIAQPILILQPQIGGGVLRKRIEETLSDTLPDQNALAFLSERQATDALEIGEALRNIKAIMPHFDSRCDLRTLRIIYLWDSQLVGTGNGVDAHPQSALKQAAQAVCEAATQYGVGDVRHTVLWKLGQHHQRMCEESVAPALAFWEKQEQQTEVFLLQDAVDTGAILAGISDEAISLFCVLCAANQDVRTARDGFRTLRFGQLNMGSTRVQELRHHRSAEWLEGKMSEAMGYPVFADRFLKECFGANNAQQNEEENKHSLREGMRRAVRGVLPKPSDFCALLPAQVEDVERQVKQLGEINLDAAALDRAAKQVLTSWRSAVEKALGPCLRIEGAKEKFIMLGKWMDEFILFFSEGTSSAAKQKNPAGKKRGENKHTFIMRNMLERSNDFVDKSAVAAACRLCAEMKKALDGNAAESIPAYIDRLAKRRKEQLQDIKLTAETLSLYARQLPGVDSAIKDALPKQHGLEEYITPHRISQGEWDQIAQDIAARVQESITLSSLTNDLNNTSTANFSKTIQERMAGSKARLLHYQRGSFAGKEDTLREHYIISEALILSDDRKLPGDQNVYRLLKVPGHAFDNVVSIAELAIGPEPDKPDDPEPSLSERRNALLNSLSTPSRKGRAASTQADDHPPRTEQEEPENIEPSRGASPLGLSIRVIDADGKVSLGARDWNTNKVTVTVSGYDQKGVATSQSEVHNIVGGRENVLVDLLYGQNEIVVQAGFGASETVSLSGKQRTIRCRAKVDGYSWNKGRPKIQLEEDVFDRYFHALVDCDADIGQTSAVVERLGVLGENISFTLPLQGRGPWLLWQQKDGSSVRLRVDDKRQVFVLNNERSRAKCGYHFVLWRRKV